MNKKQIIKNSILNTFSQCLVFVVTFLFIAYISRKLSKIDLAIFSLIQVFQAIFSIITYLGLTTSAIRLIPELETKGNYDEVSNIVRTTLFLPLVLFIPLAIVAFFLRDLISLVFLKTPYYGNYIKLILINLVFILTFDRIILLLQSLQKFFIIALLNISYYLFQRIFAILFFYKNYGLSGILYGFLLGSFIFSVIGFLILKRYIFFKSSLNFNFKKLVKFSIPYWLQGIARFGFTQIDLTLVGIFFTPEKLAGYYIAKKIISPFILLLETPLQVVIPKLSGDKVKGVYATNKNKVNKVYFLLLFFVSILLLFFSKFLITLIGGRDYISETYILRLFILYLLGYVLFSVFSVDVYILKPPVDLLKLNLTVGITSIIFTGILAKFIGVGGIVMGQSIGLFFGSIYSKKLLKK